MPNRINVYTAGTLLVALSLTGCKSTTKAASPATPSATVASTSVKPSTTSSASSSPSKTPAGKPKTAAEAAALLASVISTIKVTAVYTAATDPNHLQGRPGGYTSKSAFTDTAIDQTQIVGDDPGDVDFGGGFEVYPSSSGAMTRGEYIESAQTSTGILGHEYDYTAGPVLIRLSSYYTPTQAAAVAAAYAKVTGVATKAIPES